MIPRTKVDYGFQDLSRALLTPRAVNTCRSRLAQQLKDYTGEKNVLLMPSGRAGLYFLLKSLGRQRVVVPGFTCKAVVEAALLAGREVVTVDVEPDGFNLSIPALERVADATTVVIATHQFGIPCNIEALLEVCRRRGALVIEDAAASLGSRVGGRLTGTFGDAAFCSFDSTKLVNVPLKAGFVTVKDPGWFARLGDLFEEETREPGIGRRVRDLSLGLALLLLESHLLYRIFHALHFQALGRFTEDGPDLDTERNALYSLRMPEWQALIASRQMERIEKTVERRRELFRRYREELSGCDGFRLPPADDAGEWACIRFPIRVAGDKLAFYRRAARLGVDLAFSFTFISCSDDCTRSRRLADEVLDLPFYTKLRPVEQRRVASVIRRLGGRTAS